MDGISRAYRSRRAPPRAIQSVQGFISDMDSLSLERKNGFKGLVDFIIERSGLIGYHKNGERKN